ncbi:MAG: substrate-binding domain-containing protein [Verrucomicrobiae bacterium]|nr:substrate-binding domain-containing protein [Verrucomicrobiae bacterium]
MSTLPQRLLLTDQTTALLRDLALKGHWGATLPSEADLCREFQISRVTLRRALLQLAREGIILMGGRGRHHRIIRPVSETETSRGRTVRMLSPYPRHRVNTTAQLVQNALLERLAKEGYLMQLEVHPGFYQRFSEREMRRLLALPDTAGWLLYLSTREQQEYFAKSGQPCVVLGTVHRGVPLANVEFDVRSSSRHAAGLFLARGRQEMIFVTPSPMTAGDQASAEGFIDGASRGRPPGRARLVNYDTTVPDLCRVLREEMERRPCPNAILVGWPEHTFTVIGFLHKLGLRVPEDVAVISRVDDQYLAYSIPSVARYRVDGERMGRRAAELLLDQIQHGPGKIRSIRLLPEFVPGETLG